MSELKSCPYCGAPVEELSDGRHTWGLVRHHSGCLFPNLHNHEIPECDFEAWNTRAERTCELEELARDMYKAIVMMIAIPGYADAHMSELEAIDDRAHSLGVVAG